MSKPTSRQQANAPEQAAGPPPGARPLSREDLAILALEDTTVAGHTCKIVLLEAGIELAALRASVAARLDDAPELRLRLADIDGSAWWVPDPAIDLDAQIVLADPPATDGEPGLLEAVASVFRQHLDRSRPMWRMDLVPRLPDGGSAVIWRIHHALADGSTCMRLASAVLWDADRHADASPGSHAYRHADTKTDADSRTLAQAKAHSSAGAASHDSSGPGTLSRTAQTARRWLGGVLAAVRELPQPWLASPFDGAVGGSRSVAFASASLTGLHQAAGADGATINDAVLSVIAGGLQRWADLRHGNLEAVRVKVPVSLHGAASAPDLHGQPGSGTGTGTGTGTGSEDGPRRPSGGHGAASTAQPGNRDSFFCLDLPLGPATPRERLAAVRRETFVRKRGRDAQLLDAFLARLAGFPRLRRLAERLLASPQSFALNVSNVRGPREPVSVLCVPVTNVYTLAEIRDRHALRISVVSLAGTLGFGFVADPALLPDVDRLAASVQAEAEALAAT
jgi:diacylglycerol O-acyltransferase / wax synthase